MLPHHHHVNGYGEGGAEGGCVGSSDEEGSEGEGGGGGAGGGPGASELAWQESGVPARALAALNAMRKSRQFHDVVLLAAGAEVPAHRAVLAALSPYLFEAFTAAEERASAPAAQPLAFKLGGWARSADALRALVEYAYTGAMQLRADCARDLYECAWALRAEEVRERCADYLLHHLTLDSCLGVRALPGLSPTHAAAIDQYIAHNFRRLCESSALAALPAVRLEVVREATAARPADSPTEREPSEQAVAAAALQWLRAQLEREEGEVDELCARTHLVFRVAGGELRDCGDVPAARGDPPELAEYRRAAAARRPRAPRTPPPMGPARAPLFGHDLGERAPPAEWAVLACERLAPAATLALCNLSGRLAQVSITSRSPADAERAPDEPEAALEAASATRLATMERGRCAHGTAVLGGALVAVGGYDRAEVLRTVERYCPASNAWSSLAELRTPRARFGVAVSAGRLYAVGGSDGHNELATVDVFSPGAGPAGDSDEGRVAGGGVWGRAARLPRGVAQAGVCALDDDEGGIVCAGGWEGGVFSRNVYRYSARDDAWTDAPPLERARSQCAAVCWRGALWVAGGCDAWHCLASTERIALPLGAVGAEAAAAWQSGPPLPTARRAVGGVVWRDRLVAAGGSDGGASLRRVDCLAEEDGEWRPLPALRQPRAALGVGVVQDTLYAVGGFTGKDFLSSMECLLQPDGEWTELSAERPRRPLPCRGQAAEEVAAESNALQLH